MSPFRAALLALLVASASVATLPAAATAGDVGDPTGDAATVGDTADATGDAATPPATLDAAAGNGTANNTTFGADISSFMQSNAAEVGEAVETGMWTAAYNATENRTTRVRLVERRTGDLRAELTDLRERKQELLAEREAGNVSDAAYKARVGQIVGQINALESAINATESRAREVNSNVENVTRLRTETGQLAGPEIGTVARNLRGVDGSEGGPPDVDASDGTDADTGNGVDADDGNDAGDGNGVGNGDTNDVGNSDGNGDGNDVGNGDGNDVGNGDTNDVGNGDENDVDSGDGIERNDDVTNAENETTTATNDLGVGLGGVAAIGTQHGLAVSAPTTETATERGGVVGFVADALDARW